MTSHWKCRVVVGLLGFILVASGTAHAAQSGATISGSVLDASGAALPGATVAVTNVGTGVVETRVADDQGRYTFPNLPIGTYNVTGELVGFQTVRQTGIVLTVGREVLVDFSLPVGQLAETLTVVSQAATVETTSSALSNLVDATQIRDLPLNGRNFEQLVTLAPGVIAFTSITRGAFYGAGDAFTVSGSRPNGQVILLDNTNVMTYENRGSGAGILGTSMGVDAIAEFQTLTNTYGAQYGGNGAVVNSISKSGTNAYHASAFQFYRNSKFDALDYFQKLSGTKAAPFNRSQFGGTIGGPIRTNKVFFFVNYEGLQQKLASTQNYTVLNALGRQGYLPTTAPGGKGPAGTYTCFGAATGNTPTEGPCAIAPAIRPILNFYNAKVPLPAQELLRADGTPTGTGTYTQHGNEPGRENYVLGRVDFSVSEKTTTYVRYLFDFADLKSPFSGSYDLYPSEQRSHNQFLTNEWRRVYSNNFLGTTRFAYMRPLAQLLSTQKYPEMEFYPGSNLPDGRITVTGLVGGGAVLGSVRQNPLRLMYNRFHVGEDFVLSGNAHTLRFGGEITRQHPAAIQNAPSSGEWTFTSIPNFLQGSADRFSGLQREVRLTNGTVIPGTDGQRDWVEYRYVGYVQDDWRMSSKLTMNLGLRWAPTSNPYEIHDKMTHIIPLPMFLGSQSCTVGSANCSAAGTVLTNGFTPVDRVMDKNESWKNIAPRIGFAWDPFGDYKTSIRGGYGVFHAVMEARDYQPGYSLIPPFALVSIRGTNAAGAIVTNGLPFSQIPATQSGPGVSVSQAQRLGWNRFNTQTPYMQQWNLSFQRQLAASTVATVAYVGSHGSHFYSQRNVNPPVVTPNPSYNYGVQFGTGTGTTLIENPTVSPYFGPLILGENIAWSRYKSLQLSLVRRLLAGLQSQVSYTWSNSIDTNSGSWGLDRGTIIQNPYDPDAEEGRSSFDVRHNLVVNGSYTLPFQGSPWVEGWQLSGIFTYRTGLPVNITAGIIRAFDNDGANSRPNYVPNAAGCNGDPVLSKDKRYPSTGNPIWVNTSCFELPRLGELGNTPRNSVEGPDFRNVDLAIMKSVRLGASSLQLRWELFNAFNRVNFGVPNGAIFTGTGAVNVNAGRVSNIVGSARQVQFGAKLTF